MAASPRASWSSALRLLMPGPEERFSAGDARDAMFLSTLLHPAAGGHTRRRVRKGTGWIEFLARPSFAHFSLLAPLTFQELVSETGVPVDLPMTICEAIGSAPRLPVVIDQWLTGSVVTASCRLASMRSRTSRPSGS